MLIIISAEQEAVTIAGGVVVPHFCSFFLQNFQAYSLFL
jgi:hypothetical protein